MNCSVTYAFYVLALFYVGLKPLLKPYKPATKFLCVKMVLFLSFWQVKACTVIDCLEVLIGCLGPLPLLLAGKAQGLDKRQW